MNRYMSDEEYEKLPFREDIKGDYVFGQYYRARGDSGIFQYMAFRGEPPLWWCFGRDRV